MLTLSHFYLAYFRLEFFKLINFSTKKLNRATSQLSERIGLKTRVQYDEKQCMKTHFRRCHICSAVNFIDDKLVERCESCGKSLRSFLFFNELQAMGIEVAAVGDVDQDSSNKEHYILKKHYPPVRGLTVYWSDKD